MFSKKSDSNCECIYAQLNVSKATVKSESNEQMNGTKRSQETWYDNVILIRIIIIVNRDSLFQFENDVIQIEFKFDFAVVIS